MMNNLVTFTLSFFYFLFQLNGESSQHIVDKKFFEDFEVLAIFVSIFSLLTVTIVLLILYIRTLRQKREQFIRNEERFRTFFELSSDAIYCHEMKNPIPVKLQIADQLAMIWENAHIAECNFAYARYFGYSHPSELIGLPSTTIVKPDDPKNVKLLTKFIENNYRIDGLIYERKTKDGKIFFIRNSFYGVIKNDNLLRIWGSLQNVTEQINLQMKLEETSKKYQNLIENLNSIVLHWTKDGNILFMNKYGYNFFGYSPDELIGKNVIGTIVPETESITQRNLITLMDEILKNPLKYEYNENENIKKDGTRVWISWKNTPIFDEKGDLSEILSVGIDITGRKIAEMALQDSEKRYRLLIENLPLPTFVLHNDSIIFANALGKDLLSELQSSDSSASSEDFFGGVNLLNLYSNSKNNPNEAIRKNISVVIHGQECVFSVNSVPIQFGKKNAILIVLNEITEQKRYTQYLEDLKIQLQQQKKELERVNQELRELNATKDKFFSIIAHDLKNPIYGVRNLSQEFFKSFEELQPDEMKEFISAIHFSSSHLADLLEDLLLWSRTQTGTFPYNPVEIDVAYIVQNTLSLFSQQARQKNIVIIPRIVDGTTAFADVACVSTILRNLISNAIKFTSKGGLIKIFSENYIENGKEFVKIAISDSGIGIPYEHQDKILRLDYVITSLGTEGEHGTGLGLTIAKELVELNGGKLWFESQPGIGSTFFFVLPKKEEKYDVS